ncbi:copper amine oxidase N-terminal domain-containing protein [Paenibacillus aurantiacus]|uniref:Copper amine oxidase N-terminal domain-containing protein n=1 Tax=Paenibacillus aurantiacus TaxID=1936118 RepID=A0ABV5KII6_9BACL
MIKTGLKIAISMLLLSSTAAPAFAASTGKGITTVINGTIIQPDVNPVIEKGRTLVPIRALASLDLEFLWDGRDKIATVKNKDGKYAMLRLDETMARVNGQEVKLDAPVTVIQGRVFVPLRFISEAFGFQVQYDAERSMVTIDRPAFAPGVFIDWESANDPILNDVIKENLQNTLKSMANKDQAAFKSVFIQNTASSAFLYLLDNEYRFESLGEVRDNGEGRIEVPVAGKVKNSEGTVKTTNLIFYYMKNKQGEWRLASID